MPSYSYTRISNTEALVESEDQHLKQFANEQGFKLDDNVIDSSQQWRVDFQSRASAKTLLDKLKPGDVVLTESLESIFSNCEDMQDSLRLFKLMQVKLFVADLGGDISDPDFAPSFTQVLSAFHKLEKCRSTERIKAVKQSQRSKGRFLGGSRPFGYMIHSNGRLIENPMEQRVLKKIIKLKQQGKSLRTISTAVSTPLIPVSFKTVQRLLKRHAENPETGRSLEFKR